MSEEKQEVLREHLDECFRHFGQWFNSKITPCTPGRLKAMQPMIDFMGASRQTVQRWLDGRAAVPTGILRIRMMCYLDLHGYKVIEFERMASTSKVMRNFSELIGYNIITPEEAVTLSGYVNSSWMYAVLFGKGGSSKDKDDRMWNAWKERRDVLEAKKKEAWDKYRLKVLFKSLPKSRVVQQLALTTAQSNGSVAMASHSAILSIIENSLVLFEEGVFENLSPRELASFAQPILRLSSRLSDLSSKVLTVKGNQ